jgi:hypothetical protein
MADGSTKAIEDIRDGDEVAAADPEQGPATSPHRVTATTKSQTMRFFRIEFDSDANGRIDGEFEVTGEHPIWTQNLGWRLANELRVGDSLQTADGRSVAVAAISIVNGYSKTYNFTVDGVSTYFIVANGTSLLVHNNPRIHGVAPDWATKGAHVTTTNGLEIYLHGGGDSVKIGPVFARDAGNAGLNDALKEVEAALEDDEWRARLLDRARKATEMLGEGTRVERAGSGGTRALEVTLERWCK